MEIMEGRKGFRNREHFASYIGVTDPQYMMITLIAENADATVSKLAELLGVSSQFVTAEIAKLTTKRIVAKKRQYRRDPDRRRLARRFEPDVSGRRDPASRRR
jgi:DNA-binding MarR family transcriptional regulator